MPVTHSYLSSINKWACFPHPTLVWCPRSVGTSQNVWIKLIPQNYRDLAMVKLHDPNFNRFWLIHPCDRQTGGQVIAYSALCMCCHVLKNLLTDKCMTTICILPRDITWPKWVELELSNARNIMLLSYKIIPASWLLWYSGCRQPGFTTYNSVCL